MKVVAILAMTAAFIVAGEDWRSVTTCEDVVRVFPERVDLLFGALDLEREDLAAVKAAWDQGDKPAACAALIAHYATSPAGEAFRKTEGSYQLKTADKVLGDQLIASGLWFKIPRGKDGGIDWSYRGPKGYDNNQMGQINRYPWARHLLFAGLDGKGDKYLDKLDEYLRDWCAHTAEHHQFPAKAPPRNWPRISDRKLNAGIRMRDSWPTLFYSLLPKPQFRDATRILMLAAIADHGNYLRKHHAKKGNHLMMELTGLAMMTVAFPELKGRKERLAYVRKLAAKELRSQFYPEGVQKELCQNYHSIVVRDFEHLERLYAKAGLEADPDLKPTVLKGWEHLALAIKPNGKNLFFNDTNDQSHERIIRAAAERYGRPDWLYPLSNGAEGEKPEKGPSLMYPWSGRLVSRDDWSRGTRWSAFDIGPWGIGHAHSDKLHLSVHHHRDLLVDSGRYTYKNYMSRDPRDLRGYVRRSWGHNVILVDEQSQEDDAKEVRKPAEYWAVTDAYDFALGTWFRGWFGQRKGVHQRAVFYLKGRCWVVCDRIALAKPGSISALWHFHPDCTVPQPEPEALTTVTADPGKGNLRLLPVGGPSWTVEIVKGRKQPYFQGWWSAKQNEIVPSPCAVYATKDVKDARFAWLITTAEGAPAALAAELLEAPDGAMRVAVKEGQQVIAEVAVDFTGENAAMPLGEGMKLEKRHAVRITPKE